MIRCFAKTRIDEKIAEYIHGILSEIGGTISANVLIIIISLMTAVSAANILGPHKRGELAFAIVFVALISSLADIGINQAVPYYASRNPGQYGEILGTFIVLAFVQGVAASLIGWLFLLLKGQHNSSAAIYLISVPFSLITTCTASFFMGSDRLKEFNIIRTAQASSVFFGLILCLFWVNTTMVNLLAITIIIIIIFCLMALALANQVTRIKEWKLSFTFAKKYYSYGIKSYLGNLCWLINSKIDQLMITNFLSFSALGIYATAVSYAGVIFSFLGAFAMVAFAKAASVPPSQGMKVVFKYLKMSMIFGIPTTVMIAIIAPIVFPIAFGKIFIKGVIPAVILTFGGCILGINYILSNGLRALNYPLKPSGAEACGLIVSILGLWLLLPIWGIIGAAVVSLVSYIVTMVVLIAFIKKIQVKNA